ncbi:MAG: PEP-CTERM sorting domain-containing protein [Rhodospirillaceae bacterium]|nr:PEP-CTERM sorting domain-containing protein [Rhodospirillaceae bacterium]
MKTVFAKAAVAAALIYAATATPAQAGVVGATLGACLNADFPGDPGWECGTLYGYSNVLSIYTPQQPAALPVQFTVQAGGAPEIYNDTTAVPPSSGGPGNEIISLNVEDGSLTLRMDMVTSSMGSVPIKFAMLGFTANGLRLTSVFDIVATGAWSQNGPFQFDDESMTIHIGGIGDNAGNPSAFNPASGICLYSPDTFAGFPNPECNTYGQLTLRFTTEPLSQTGPSGVPAPGALALFGLGLLGVGALRRRA